MRGTELGFDIDDLKNTVRNQEQVIQRHEKLLENLKKLIADNLNVRISNLEKRMGGVSVNHNGGNSSDLRSSSISGDQTTAAPQPDEQRRQDQGKQNAAPNVRYFAHGSKGMFLDSHGSPEFTDKVSVYRFEKDSDTEARVYVENKLSVVKKILQNDGSLEGFCEQLNVCDDSATGIETVSPGKAILQGDRWGMADKVRVRYLAGK